MLDAALIRSQLERARERSSKPIAVNLLLPFARRAHFEAAQDADAVVTFWGRPRRRTDGIWLHQCGSVEEARAARDAGADAVIAQGREAGGHVRGELPALELLERIQAALGAGYPVLLAGGIADAADVRGALDAGAEAALLGTRFLMTDESGAHHAYKARVAEARETVLTELFGLGWPAPHRVVPNAATANWLSKERRLRPLNRAMAPLAKLGPMSSTMRIAARQRPGRPFFTPAAPVETSPDSLVEAGALYAGETAARIDDVRPAGPLTRELAGR
jgi:nitronate monooxygenase